MAELSVVIIEEMTGGKRSLELRGAGLPHKGAEWGSELAMTTTWYPGNGEDATQHILGPRELPSEWTGFWRRPMLSRSPCLFRDESGTEAFVVSPRALRDICDDMFSRGALLQVTWQTIEDGNQGREFVRLGRCKQWKFPHDTVSDIGWHFTFEWKGRGATTEKVTATRDGNKAAGKVAMALAISKFVGDLAAARIVASNQFVPNSATGVTLGQLEALADYPKKLVSGFQRTMQQKLGEIERIASLGPRFTNNFFDIAESFVDLATNTVAIGNQFSDKLTQVGAEQASLKQGVSDLTRAAEYFGKTLDEQRNINARARELAAQSREVLTRNPGGANNSSAATSGTRQGLLKAIHVTIEGDTPMGLSIRYYETPDHAVDILNANGLPWSQVTFEKGSILIIPELTKG